MDANVDTILVDTGTTLPASIATIDSNVDAVLADTGTTLPASIALIQADVTTIDTNVDTILVDTADLQANQGNWLTLTGAATEVKQDIIDTNVDAILVDTGTTLPASIATVDSNVDAVLIDTGTTLPASIAAVPTATENADALLNRNMASVSDTNARSPLNALRFLRNKWSVAGTTLTVTEEDDTTSAWTATVTTDATADPITGNDPA